MIEWGFEYLADRLGIRRRHVMFGLVVLLLCALVTGWYIYEKNWVITGTKRTGGSQKVLTLALNGGESAVQQMSQEIRSSILETPMAAASAQSAAQSLSGESAERSNPQNAAEQSAFAASDNTPNAAAAAGATSSFKPSVSRAAAKVEAGEARAETSQSMRAASTQSVAQQASGMNAARSTPQDTTAQSAAAESASTSSPASATGVGSSLAPSVSAATAKVESGRARAETSQKMALASEQSAAQSALKSNAARSNPQDASAQSASASSSASPNSASASGANALLTPSTSSARAVESAVASRRARAEASQKMVSASAQSMSQSASGMNTSRSSPQTSAAQSAASANSAAASGIASTTGANVAFTPSTSGARAATSGVRSNGARSEASQSMSGVTSQSLAQASGNAQGTARNSPAGSTGRAAGSASAHTPSASVSGAGTSGAFSPSVSGIRASVSGVRSNVARAEAGRLITGAPKQTFAQAPSRTLGTVRVSPALMFRRVTASARARSPSASVVGTGASGTFTPSVSGVVSNAAVALVGRATATLTKPTPRAGTSRLGGDIANTDQVMAQVNTQLMSRPVSFVSTRSRPNSAFQPRTVSPVLTVEAAVPDQSNSHTAFVPTASPVHRTVPTLEEVRPTPPVILAKMSPPVEINRPRSGPEIAEPKSTKPEETKTDLEIFRTQGFKTRTEGMGKNFVFIIDKSGSMSQDNRLGGAREALARTLEKLEPDENYYIYFFDDKTVGMEEGRLLKATPANISSTGRWVDSLSPRGYTNPRDALTGAFDKLKPSTIWLLSDGKFSSVKHVKRGNKTRLVSLPSVLKMIRKLNVAENVRINTIGFAASQSQVDASLKDIAEENGGTYKFIRTGVE